jgi:hypothetical protein
MAAVPDGEYRHVGEGDRLALEVTGPTVESCLARAVEGLADRLADVHPSRNGTIRPVVVAGDSPSDLLRGVLDESIRLLGRGELAVLLTECSLGVTGVDGRWEVVDLDGAAPSVTPWRLRWIDVRLEPVGGNWVGRMLASV